MNINHFLPRFSDEPFVLTPAFAAELLARRQSTFRAFAELEAKKGIGSTTVSLNTARGQDILRLILFRVIEETVESFSANEAPHIKEEAIDAINYLWSLLILDPEKISDERARIVIFDSLLAAENIGVYGSISRFFRDDIATITIQLAGDLCDLLRNRSWMNHAQDPYFVGTDRLIRAIKEVTVTLLKVFDSFDDFARYYLAKDEVLKFRIRSHY